MSARPWRTRMLVTSVASVCALLAPAAAAGATPAGAGRADPAAAPEEPGHSAAAMASAELADRHGVDLAPAVLAELDTGGVADFWVDLAERADLSGADRIVDWGRRGRFVYQRLRQTAQASQAGLVARLRLRGVEVETFWLANTVLVRGAEQSVLDGVLSQPGVAEVRADRPLALPDPIRPAADQASPAAVEWGIANVRAEQVWSQLGVRGEGVVVGSIDTGVDFTHPALVDQYRGNLGDGAFDHNYQWWDPTSVCPNPEPCDNNNHGTHTTGTMVGDDRAGNQIGVAPAARWIAAKGCEDRTCSEAALLSAGQFMLAPTTLAGTDPRPELRPHIINNSWGGGPGEPWYDQLVAGWVAAGIFPAFANGNDGPGCGTAGSPGDGPDAYAVGAHDSADQIAEFSSRGPGRAGEIRPDLTAPGVAVRSAVPGGYGVGSGTSMATPHLAGTVALMWSASGQPGDLAATRAALDETAIDTEDLSCGGTPADNNVHGQGRLDALAATLEIAVNTGVTGTVTDATDDEPLAGVTVRAGGGRERRTDDAGGYTLRLEPGRYSLTFSRFGYLPRTVPDLAVGEEGFVTLDVGLEPSPAGRVTGTVTDQVSGHTVPGVTIEVLDVPEEFRASTGGDGGFQLPALPVGSYRIRASSPRPGLWSPPPTQQVRVAEGGTTAMEFQLPRTGAIERVSVSSDGAQASRRPTIGHIGAISDDGRYVAFRSPADNLVDTSLTREYNVYVHDRQTGVTELVPAGSYHPSLSADGRYLAVTGPAGQAAEQPPELPALPRYWPDLTNRAYLLDRSTGELELASVNRAGEAVGTPANNEPVVTPDGRYVAYQSNAPQLVDGERPRFERESFFELRHAMPFQVVVHDRVTGASDVVSVSGEGELDESWAGKEAALTPDGRYVAFRSRATNLVDEPTNPGYDIFVHDRVTGATEWVSVLDTPGTGLNGITVPRISDNGRTVTYHRGVALGGYYDRLTGEAGELSVPLDGLDHFFTFSGAVAVSGDGRRITFFQVTVADPGFETAVPAATGLFVMDRDTGQFTRLRDIDWGGLEDNGYVPTQLSRDGRFGLGLTGSDDLVPGDTNGVDDLYLVDLAYDPDRHQPRFAVWDLSVAPAVPQPGEPVQVAVRVKNVGDVTGDYPAVLLVDDVREPGATELVQLAPGESTEVSLPVSRTAGGAYRVRIGQATGQFRVPAGALTGLVTDANDGDPIDGATVTATNRGITRTATTIGGAYQLDDLQVGSWTVRVQAGGYRTEAAPVALTQDRQQVRHDRALPTGVVEADPGGVAVTVPAGRTAAGEVRLANPGSADLAWQGYAWEATTPEPPSILVYTSAGITDTPIDQALGRLGLAYTAFREDGGCDLSPPWDGIDRFGEALRAGDWDLVIVDHSCGFAELTLSTAEALEQQVRDGGRLIIYSDQIRKDPQFRLWEAVGVELVATLPSGHGPYSGYWWESGHPLFHTPLPVPEYVGRGVSMVAALPGAEPLAGYTLTARPQHAGLVLGNQGRTLYQGFRPQQPGDLDGNGVPDGVQLWVNSIVQIGGLTAQPWLSAAGAGTLPAGGGAEFAVSVDASRLPPGSYQGTVSVATDAGQVPQVSVPVRLTVTEPPACDRTITGTHVGPLVVNHGVTCLTGGARVVGPVAVRPGAGLVATGATVLGGLSTHAATVLDLRQTSVTGPVLVAAGTGLVWLAGNRITGPVSLVHNQTGGQAIVVSGNQITGPLSCLGNQPPPVNQGVPNTGVGPRTGQCAGL